MAHVLLAWEQGLNLGHLVRIGAIVHALHNRRHKVTLAISLAIAVRYAGELKKIACQKFVVGEPRHSVGWRAPKPRFSFAGVLASQGWTDAQWLLGSTTAWMRLLSSIKPTSVVLDYAPIAALAAFLLKVPALHVSSGFDAPPPGQTGIGRYRSSTGEVSAAEAAEVTSIEDSMHQALKAGGILSPSIKLRDLLSHSSLLLDCIPQTDPYGSRKNTIYAPFLSTPEHATIADWPQTNSGRETHRVFAYVRDRVIAAPLLDFFLRSGSSVVCLWPGYEPHFYHPSGPGLAIFTELLDLSALFEQTSLVVGYGSVGLSTRAVLAKIPQLVLPSDIEKLMVGHRIQQQGLGICLEPGWDELQLAHAFDQIRFDQRWTSGRRTYRTDIKRQMQNIDFYDEIQSFVEKTS